MHNFKELLNEYMSLYWLRPETACLLTLRSIALEGLVLNAKSADISCGDGIFPFVHFGGRFDKNFDIFFTDKSINDVRIKGEDLFDSFSDSYAPVVKHQPTEKYSIGIDVKESSLSRANTLDFYNELKIHDVTKALNYSDNEFDIITNFASINHYPSVEPFLSECYRTLKPGGKLYIVIQATEMIRYYSKLDKLYPPYWVNIIERNMRNVWSIMKSRCEWENLFKRMDFEIEGVTSIGNSELSKIWNVGLRPIAPELVSLVRIAKEHEPESLHSIKYKWVNLFNDLAEPFLYNDTKIDNAMELLFVLKK